MQSCSGGDNVVLLIFVLVTVEISEHGPRSISFIVITPVICASNFTG
jgi:hypothetical protein